MPLHPMLQAMLDKAAALPPMITLPIEQIRATDATRYKIGQPIDEVHSTEDRLIPGPRGDIRIRIYRPDAGAARPVTVFFHGGGFVVCNLESHDPICRQICRRSGTVVVSVDYRLAPESQFPAPRRTTASPRRAGSPRMRRASAAIPHGWPSPATAQVATWRP